MKRYKATIKNLITNKEWWDFADEQESLQTWYQKQVNKGPRHLGYPERWIREADARPIDLERKIAEEMRDTIFDGVVAVNENYIQVPSEYSLTIEDNVDEKTAEETRLEKRRLARVYLKNLLENYDSEAFDVKTIVKAILRIIL